MISNNISFHQLRIFEAACRLRSATLAARELHLTQSGVSQHLKAFESMVGTRLFDRIKRRLVPTSAAIELQNKSSLAFIKLEEALFQAKGSTKTLTGTIIVGTPPELGNNIVLPALARFGLKHPDTRFYFRVGFSREMSRALSLGEVDFAFVDAGTIERGIDTKPVYNETLHLCATPEYTRKHKGKLETLEYVSHEGGEQILRLWFMHHLKMSHPRLKIRAKVFDVQGVARLVLNHFAAGIIPGHLIEKLKAEGRLLHVFHENDKPLINRISIAHLKGRTLSQAAAQAMEFVTRAC